jgi:hypothetical protein
MKFRKLRIAWSVAWGIACVLLVAFWVKSYWAEFVIPLPTSSLWLSSYEGRLNLLSTDDSYDSACRINWSVPYWLTVVPAIAFGAASLIRWRFSLRTLLIATTLVAVVLGLIVYATRQ